MSEKSKKQVYEVTDFFSKADHNRHLAVWKNKKDVVCILEAKSENESVQDVAHAELIADTFNTFESSGLIPSIILRQRNELLEILNKIIINHDASISSLKEAVLTQ